MKRCPNCNQVFSDDNVFCLEDGTVLETTPGASYSGDTPTQVISPFPAAETSGKKEANKNIYAIIGVMLVVIIGLAAIVFYLMPGAKEEKKDESNTAQNSGNQSQTGGKTQITREAAQDLINRWEQAQDTRNFDAYRVCYAPQFIGIKRTKSGSETEMNYTEWINDRQKMAKNIIDVSVENLNITIEGDTAIAQFVQNWKSVNYQDTGQKTMRIKMFDDGAKIVYEDLKFVYSN